MKRRRAKIALLLALAVLSLLSVLPGESAVTISPARFAAATRLRPWWGGEPSIAFDANGAWAYVVAPQGGPAATASAVDTFNAVDEALCKTLFDCPPAPAGSGVRYGNRGVGFWASYNGGRSFGLAKLVGSGLGGWDSDVVVAPDHTVYVADLDVSSATICSSSNRGQSFTGIADPDSCETATLNQAGPSNDRPWLSVGRRGELYLTYHEIGTGLPIILKSTDKGKSFTPCGSILDPQGPAGQNYSPLGGTLVGKPVIGKDGSIFIAITEPDAETSPTGGPLTNLYLAVARGGCTEQTVFKNYRIFSNSDAEFTLFNFLAADGGGVLYSIVAGRTGRGQTGDSIWLFVSRNGGASWSAPIRVNHPSVRGNVMPAIVGGLKQNQVAISWFGTTTNGDPNYTKNQWRLYVATSFDGGRRFYQTTVTPSPIHFGAICTVGVICDPTTPEGNRNLLDFTSVAINPRNGCLVLAYPGDPWNRPDVDPDRNDGLSSAYVAMQNGGTCLR